MSNEREVIYPSMPLSEAVQRIIRAKEDSERSPQGMAARLLGSPQWGVGERIPVDRIDEARRTIMSCGRTDVHWTHFWQYSATGWVSCYGIPEPTPIYTALMTTYEKFVDPYADIELDQRMLD